MTVSLAPAYVAAQALAVALIAETRRVPPWARAMAAEPLVAEARELTCDIAEALAFPAVRVAAAARADRRAGRIRVLLRVARDAGALTPAACQRHGEAVAAIGAMLGGWQKRIENGAGRAAITASSAVVPGTTTPGTCAPPTATGGGPTTGTTTSGSASSSPPPEPDSAPAGPAEQARSPRRATARRTSSRRSAPGDRRDPSPGPESPNR